MDYRALGWTKRLLGPTPDPHGHGKKVSPSISRHEQAVQSAGSASSSVVSPLYLCGVRGPSSCDVAKGSDKKDILWVLRWTEKWRQSVAFYLHPWPLLPLNCFTQLLLISGTLCKRERVKEVEETQIRYFANNPE